MVDELLEEDELLELGFEDELLLEDGLELLLLEDELEELDEELLDELELLEELLLEDELLEELELFEELELLEELEEELEELLLSLLLEVLSLVELSEESLLVSVEELSKLQLPKSKGLKKCSHDVSASVTIPRSMRRLALNFISLPPKPCFIILTL